MNAKPPLDTVDYEAIEAAVMETPRGRWFLSEFLRRHQAKETTRLLDAIARLERALQREAALSPRVRAVLMGTAASLCRHVNNAPPALPVATTAMATETRAIAEALSTLARAAGDAQETDAGRNDGEGRQQISLADLAHRQWELAAQMEILSRGLAELAALVDADMPVSGPDPAIPADALQWFAAHDDLFDAPAQHVPDAHPARPQAETVSSPPQTAAPDQAASSTSEPSPDAAGLEDEGKSREGHLTVLIRPCQAAAGKDAEDTARSPGNDRDEDARGQAAASRRPTRIIIRHKSSSEDVAIPFLEGTDGREG